MELNKDEFIEFFWMLWYLRGNAAVDQKVLEKVIEFFKSHNGTLTLNFN